MALGLARLRGKVLSALTFQCADLLLDQPGHPMPNYIDLGDAGSEQLAHISRGHSFQAMQIKNLVVFGRHFLLHPLHGGVDQILLPFGVPEILKAAGIARLEHERLDVFGPGVGRKWNEIVSFRKGFAKVIDDAIARYVHEPAFEGTDLRFVAKVLHVPRHADDGLLNHVLSVSIGQTCANGGKVDQLPVGIEKLLPGALVIQVAQAFEQAQTRRR